MEGSRGPGRAGQGGRKEARKERRQGIEGAGNEGGREGEGHNKAVEAHIVSS